MKPLKLLEYIRALEDLQFDLTFPPEIRGVSYIHWTPVRVAQRAAEFLVRGPETRVLDIGCGPGKFCIVGAITTPGTFTGIEQRKHLYELADATIRQIRLPNVKVIHGNVLDLSFSKFDAFYLFNPFEENLMPEMRIDESVKLKDELYEQYVEHVAFQLAVAPIGTRVASYCGGCEEIPIGYDCLEESQQRGLKLWEKTRHHPVLEPRQVI